MNKKQILIIGAGIIAIVIVLILFGLMGGRARPRSATLEVWGIFDDEDVFSEIISDYSKLNKHITINYQKKSFVDYESELINAFAADKGPDIWLVHNTWLPKHKDKIKEMPAELLSFNIFKQTFVDVVEKDFTEDNRIYGLPLYVDTLALYYNKDLFNSAGISSPPDTWEELIGDLDKLIKRGQQGGIERAGVALGTAENINRSTDILSLLMLQNGTKMVNDSKTSIVFDEKIFIEGESYNPGEDALRFYTDFSNPSKRTYTWNRQMPYSLDAFSQGKTAMMFNYSHQIPVIKEKAPYLNFAIGPMPQIKDRKFDINYANYWGFTVSKKSKAIEEAWKFILFLAEERSAKKYLIASKKPSARRDLIDWQKEDLELGVFANQSLSARTWYQIDNNAIETILANAIESIVLGSATVLKALNTAIDQIDLLMR